MAISTSSYFSNSIVGIPQVGADIDLFSSTTNDKYAVGFGFTRGDGNKYRYCHFGALTAVGQMVSKNSAETNLTKIVNVGAAVATTTTRAGESSAPNLQGSRYMQLVITATANQFAGGYLTIVNGSGSGFTYRIKGNTATSANNPVTGNVYMDLHDPIQSPIDSNSDIIIAGSAYADLMPANINTAGCMAVVGVALANVSSGSYGWIGTGGTQGVLQDVSIGTYGKPVFLSSNTIGAIQCRQSATATTPNELVLPIIGHMVEAGSSADYSLVYMTLE